MFQIKNKIATKRLEKNIKINMVILSILSAFFFLSIENREHFPLYIILLQVVSVIVTFSNLIISLSLNEKMIREAKEIFVDFYSLLHDEYLTSDLVTDEDIQYLNQVAKKYNINLN